MTRPAYFPPVVLDFLWEALGVGEPPYPLRVRSHGATVDERSLLRNEVYGDLKARGLLDARGRLRANLENWLGLLARAERSVDSVFVRERGGPAVHALAVESGATALLAEQSDDGMTVRAVPVGSLASSIVSMLPPAPRGTERSVTMPRDELAAGGAAAAGGDAEVLATIFAEPRLRAGQLGANHRDQLGGRHRAPVLSWFDTGSGRYLSYANPGRDGLEWITVAPADAATLRHRLGELLRTAGNRKL